MAKKFSNPSKLFDFLFLIEIGDNLTYKKNPGPGTHKLKKVAYGKQHNSKYRSNPKWGFRPYSLKDYEAISFIISSIISYLNVEQG